MASYAQLIKGPSVSTKGDVSYVEAGTKYAIGDNLFLTAGHVVFEYNHAHDSVPGSITTSDIVIKNGGSDTFQVKNDYRGYKNQYVTQVKAEYQGTNNPHLANDRLEAQAPLLVKDSVIISGSANVDSSSPGMVLFLNPSDMTTLSTVLPGATVSFDGYVSKEVTGGTVTSASGGQIVYSVADAPGDSGGAYLLNYMGQPWIVGSLDATNGSVSYGTYFQTSEWASINSTLSSGQAGNVSSSEARDLIVGTSGNDTKSYGTYRADTMLGMAGNDILNGGDQVAAGTMAWANDQVYGGLGNDTFAAGYGDDLFHGGDRSTSLHTASDLAADGSDTANYSTLTALDPTKGILVQIGGAAPTSYFSLTPDIAHAIYVTDLGRKGDSDTLISVEKVIGTSANDTVMISSFSSDLIANSSHLGGIDSITLGGQSTTTAHGGDQVDISGLSVGGTIAISQTSTAIYATADASHKLSVIGAEKYIASSYNDVITSTATTNLVIDGGAGDDNITGGSGSDLITGGAGNDVLKGGAGSDKLVADAGNDTLNGGVGNDIIELKTAVATIEFSKGGGSDVVQFDVSSGTYTLKLTDVNAADVDVIGGGFDAYYVMNGSEPDGMWYQFLTIRVKSTGDQITFLENGLNGVTNIGPSADPIPTGYNKGYFTPGYPEYDYRTSTSQGQLDNITFADGSSWNQALIWDKITIHDKWAYAQGDNIHGYGSGTHNEADFLPYVNQTYLQALSEFIM